MSYVTKASPPILSHVMRVDKMTAAPTEAADDWGRGWMTTPDLSKSIANSRNPTAALGSPTSPGSPESRATGKSISPFDKRNDAKEATARAKKAEMDGKTLSYTERSRFMCLGAPMQCAKERQAMRSRTQTTHSLSLSLTTRLATPITANFHPQERGPRSQSVLRRYKTAKSVRTCGLRDDYMERTISPYGDSEHLAGRCDVTGYGSKTQVIMTNDNPGGHERTMLSDELTKLFYAPTDTDEARENMRRQPLPQHKTIPFKNQMILLTKTANQPTEKRIFMSVHKGSIFDPSASLGPPTRISTPSTLNRSRPASAAGRSNWSNQGSGSNPGSPDRRVFMSPDAGRSPKSRLGSPSGGGPRGVEPGPYQVVSPSAGAFRPHTRSGSRSSLF